MVEKIYELQALIDRWAVKLGFGPALVARVIVGYGFIFTGRGKLNHPENPLNLFKSIGIPFPEANVWFISHLEYYGGFLLILGLFCRPLAALLASTMVVALLTADRGDFVATFTAAAEQTPLDVAPVPFLLPLLFLVVYGAGALSLDGLSAWLIKRKAADTQPDR